jgi:hypothetical protein
MDRLAKILLGLDVASAVGAEVGALVRPLVRKTDGQILYIDYLDQAALRAKYRTDPNVPYDEVVPVDIVAANSSAAAQALIARGGVDYIVASHVAEHVPNLVGWLRDMASALRPGGTIRLALPDFRFCFDYRREGSRLSDVMTAYLINTEKPLMREIFDDLLHHGKERSTLELWVGDEPPPLLDTDDLARAKRVVPMAMAGDYLDVHCWTLTLQSFASIMAHVCNMELLDLVCEHGFDVEGEGHEFFVVMKRGSRQEAVASWIGIATEASGPRSSDVDSWPEARRRWLRSDPILTNLRDRLDDIHRSTSWRITAPLRAVGNMLGRRRR